MKLYLRRTLVQREVMQLLFKAEIEENDVAHKTNIGEEGKLTVDASKSTSIIIHFKNRKSP